MTSAEIKTILEEHSKWLENNKNGKCADLRGVNLSKEDLRGVDLRGANLTGVTLRETDLRDANLTGAELSRADLRWANLRYAHLRCADLRGANLRCADLRGADFRGATLRMADLGETDLREASFIGVDLREVGLRWAILRYASLKGVDLRGADLREADLKGADLREADLYNPIACPEKGSFIGWKKANGHIVELEILSNAKRSSATGRKCRCDKAKVVAIEEKDGSESYITEVNSNYDKTFIYRVGEVVTVDDFDDDRWNECAPGIHFFITREEAVRYP
jgi:hypothetical protein cdifQCD-6_14926